MYSIIPTYPITNGLCGRLKDILDDLQDDVGDMEGPVLSKSNLISAVGRPRTLSQVIAEAGRPSKKPKVLEVLFGCKSPEVFPALKEIRVRILSSHVHCKCIVMSVSDLPFLINHELV